MKLLQPPALAEKEEVGGKGAQLLKLVAAGVRVPSFFVIQAAEVYEGEDDTLLQAVNALGGEWFAVRSSVTLEDGASSSFAGMFDSFLYVRKEQVPAKVKEAFAALKSDRVRAYCKEKQITQTLKMAIVVQQMLDPKCSGVAFSRSPVAPTADVVIDASWGVGEGVVAGLVETDHWRISRLGDVLHADIKVKKTRIGLSHEGGTCGYEVEGSLQNEASLTADQIQTVHHTVLQLEEQFGYPVDIEWAFTEEGLFLLQLRPITQVFEDIKTYTDTNLAESYPGITSPFTASFVKLAYRNVFAESAVLLGASTKRLQILMPHYDGLIAEVDHHLYYDLEHYYAVLSALPGGKKNIENWHRMIGGQKPGMKVPEKLHPLTVMEQIKALVKLVGLILNQDRVLSNFCDSLELQKKLIQSNLQQAKTPQETYHLIYSSLSRPLGFGLTVLNDVILMLGTKGLVSLLKKVGKSEEDLAPLLKTGTQVESLKPMIALAKITNSFPEDFWKAWEAALPQANPWGEAYKNIWQHLTSLGWHDEVAQLSGFLNDYGERSFEELKIESPTLRQSPEAFGRLLSFMRRSEGLKSHSTAITPLNLDLTRLDGLLWKWCWKVTTRSIKWREHTRLLRGQFYNLIREMMLKGATQLRDEYPVFQKFSWADLFGVELQDYENFARNSMDAKMLAEKIEANKEWGKHLYAHPEFLVLAKGETPYRGQHQGVVSGELRGQTASPGTVSGRVLIVENPFEALEQTDLHECILVTRHTDPAWVYIMSQCKGLISEKGSLLSHTAIIGRELGIPTLVGVSEAVSQLTHVENITLHASEGRIEVHGN